MSQRYLIVAAIQLSKEGRFKFILRTRVHHESANVFTEDAKYNGLMELPVFKDLLRQSLKSISFTLAQYKLSYFPHILESNQVILKLLVAPLLSGIKSTPSSASASSTTSTRSFASKMFSKDFYMSSFSTLSRKTSKAYLSSHGSTANDSNLSIPGPQSIRNSHNPLNAQTEVNSLGNVTNNETKFPSLFRKNSNQKLLDPNLVSFNACLYLEKLLATIESKGTFPGLGYSAIHLD